MRLLLRRFCYSVMIQPNLANTLNEKKKLSEWFAKHDLILNNSETKIHYFSVKTIPSTVKNSASIDFVDIQSVSEIGVLILTSGRTRQFMKPFSIIFYKIRTNFSKIVCHQFFPNKSVLCD
jgi:hypothetical protein